jgi:arylsulfatase A-like enzyme
MWSPAGSWLGWRSGISVRGQGVADNTIVIDTTDNDAMQNMGPAGGISPFRSEKDTNWEGAVRVPCLARRTVVSAPRDQP